MKYLIPLGIALFLLWLVFKDLNLKEIISRLRTADYRWVYLSLSLAFLSHYLRAYRWTLMLNPIGYNLKTPRAFLALMGGYLANMALPRLGEITRCAVLKRTDGIAMPASFGSVIMERIIDLIMLMLVVLLALFFQFGRISSFFSKMLFSSMQGNTMDFALLFAGFFIFLILILIIVRKNWARIRTTRFYKKIQPIIGDLINGLTSIRKVKNKTVFFITTFLIWLLYYLMSYVMVFSLPATSGLNPLAGLVILMAGGLGMSAPVQGGLGTYHVFVSSALLLYGIDHEDGVVYATLMHTTQFVFLVVTGSICLLISLLLVRNHNKHEQGPEQNNALERS